VAQKPKDSPNFVSQSYLFLAFPMVSTRIQDGIAILTFDMAAAPANVINHDSMQAFWHEAEAAIQNPEVKGLVITSAKKEFIVGADINMIYALGDAEEVFSLTQNLNAGFRKLETCGKPVVAALNGTALGGGLELALACHYRLAVNDSKAQIGLPEVMLGIFPGGGGTQRLPRLIGIQGAMELILQAKRLRPEEALKRGVIHALVESQAELLPAAIKWINEVGEKKQPWDKEGFKIPGGGVMSPQGAQVFTAGIALLRKETQGNYPGPFLALSAMYEGLQLSLDRALTVEGRYFAKAATSKECKHMIRTLWFSKNDADKGAARPAGVGDIPLNKVGMLGAGMMGAGIAYVTAETAKLPIVLKDVSLEGAEKGKAYSKGLLDKKLQKGHMKPEAAQEILDRITPSADAKDLAGCDLIIEAVFEDRGLKARVTQEAEAVMNPAGVFASNTSTLPITGLAEASSRPDNFIGLHFFSPVDKMPLVEIIMGEKTSDFALAMAIDYVKKIKKTPIVVNDSRGFYTSRVFATYVNEGMALLEEGIPAAAVDNLGKQAGMPVGPLALADEVSLELLYHIVKQTEQDLGVTVDTAAKRVGFRFVEEFQRVGKKAKAGFYDYPDNAKKHLWPELSKHFPAKENAPSHEIAKRRMLHIQALETVRCMQEGVLRTPQDADLGSIFGWGFAPFSGGTLSYIEFVGLPEFVAQCDELHKLYGERFEVPQLLRDMQAQGKGSFYS
jgi:3-hydroxyacyl-CoA dehydrogenase/enoyl-CoA hydratase/3-hydroxybutyryl-CoA epimerase